MHQEKFFFLIEVGWGFSCGVRDWFPTISDILTTSKETSIAQLLSSGSWSLLAVTG